MPLEWLDMLYKILRVLTMILGTIIALIKILRKVIKRPPIPEKILYVLSITFLTFLLIILLKLWKDELPWPSEYKVVHLNACPGEVCCASRCDKLSTNPAGALQYKTKNSSFQGVLEVTGLGNNTRYLLSLHNIPGKQEACPLPTKIPQLVETIIDIVAFESDAIGSASIKFNDFNIEHCWGYYDVQIRVKAIETNYNHVLCQCLDHSRFKIINFPLLIMWSFGLCSNIGMLIYSIVKYRVRISVNAKRK